eukprot:m.935066 g.935066  ORF g.935066 m.935066 type:complete len:66 (+) comp209755_c0_seq1:210-407(+)
MVECTDFSFAAHRLPVTFVDVLVLPMEGARSRKGSPQAHSSSETEMDSNVDEDVVAAHVTTTQLL